MSAGAGEPLEALVVGGVDYGEADRIVHVLTRTGRLSVFAHGARKSRRRFSGALEPFTTLAMTLEPRPRRGMPTLSQVTITRSRHALATNLEKVALASYVAEVSGAVAPEGDPTDELFALVEAVFERLLAGPATVAVRRAYELALVDTLGYRPRLDACSACEDDPGDRAYLDLHRGGLLCETHRERGHRVGPRTVEWMARLLSRNQEGCFDETAGLPEAHAELAAQKLEAPVAAMIHALIGRALRSLDLLREVGL